MQLKISGLCKRYADNIVLSNVNLSINEGQIYCLLGRNGAGKSTVINILADLIDADSGSVTLDNHSITESKNIIGLQSQYQQLIDELSAAEYLEFIGILYKVEKRELIKRTHALLSFFFEKNEDITANIYSFSTGMKKKLTICSALIHKPSILLLDEPFANLDLPSAEKLCRLLSAYVSSDRIIIISSHDLLYVDKVATHLGILVDGDFKFNGSLNEFKDNGAVQIETQLLKYLKPEEDISHLIFDII